MLSCFNHVQLCATLWTVAHQAPLSMGFSRQEYWSGLPFSFPEDFLNPGLGTWVSHIAGRFFTIWATRKAPGKMYLHWKYSSCCMCAKLCLTLCDTPCQTPLSMGFSRQECWSGLPFPPPGDLPYPRSEPVSLASPALAGRFFTIALPEKPKI